MGHKRLDLSDPSENYPAFLKEAKNRAAGIRNASSHPVLFSMEDKNASKNLDEFIKKHTNIEVVDNYSEQYAELLLSKNAHLYRANYEVQVASIKDLLVEHYGNKKSWELGSWVYFPWKNQLVHVLNQEDFEELRTIRNRDLITREEQKILHNFNCATFGMSVGSAGALALGISGISRNAKLIDGAVISGSNLNRIMTGVSSVGLSKSEVIGRQLYEMNPYAVVEYFDKANASNIADIFEKSWHLNAVVDEIDDIEMKVRIRSEARKRKLPVVMATELGDTVMLDVERYDIEPDRPLFHGAIPEIEELLSKNLENYREWTKHAVRIIDPINMPIKMQKSVLKIGTSVVTHPQLGSTVMITGGVLAFAIKNIALGNPLNSGRYVISLEGKMLADHKTRKYRRQHKKHTKVIHKSVNSM